MVVLPYGLWLGTFVLISQYVGTIAQGICSKPCPGKLDVVCGSDGISYRNKCALQKHQCVTFERNNVIAKGACANGGCFRGFCQDENKVCRLTKNRQPACTCKRSCLNIEKPVCGSDYKEYKNVCFLRQRACMTNTDIDIAHEGRCEGAREIAGSLAITYKVLFNMIDPPTGVAQLNLTNTGKMASGLPERGYSILLCQRNRLYPSFYNPALKQYSIDGMHQITTQGFLVKYNGGCMYEFEAVHAEKLLPNNTLTIPLRFISPIVTKARLFPNLYIKDKNNAFAIVKNTRKVDTYVYPFNNIPSQSRFPGDVASMPLEPQDRFIVEQMRKVTPEVLRSTITPIPKTQYSQGGQVNVTETWKIYTANARFLEHADYLSKKINVATSNQRPTNEAIVLQLGPRPANIISDEWYKLDVENGKITLTSENKAGISNAIQSLITILGKNKRSINLMSVVDYPRFGHRALMVDLGSNFLGYDTYIRLLDLMAHYKLNKLPLIFGNNYGFRLEIPGIPELTTVGGKRCEGSEMECIPVQLGSNPNGKGSGNGYFTGQQYKEFLRQADLRNIEVIPTLNMGRDARAAILAMEAYGRRTKNHTMNLIDRSEKTMTIDTEFSDSSINPCRTEALNFFDKIVGALKKYHEKETESPLTICLNSNLDLPQIRSSPSCFPPSLRGIGEAKAQDHANKLKVDYTMAMHGILAKHNAHFCAVDNLVSTFDSLNFSSLSPHNSSRYGVNPTVIINNFNPPAYQRIPLFAGANYAVILSPSHLLSFHYAEEVDPELPGDADNTRRVLTMPEIHNYAPLAHCCNLPIPSPTGCVADERSCEIFPSHHKANVMGIQATLSTHSIRSPGDFFYLIRDKLFFFGLKAWHEYAWERVYDRENLRQLFIDTHFNNATVMQDKINSFLGYIELMAHNELPYRAEIGFPLTVPRPGGIYNNLNRMLNSSHLYPGYVIQYRSPGGNWENVRVVGDGQQLKYINTTAKVIQIRAVHPYLLNDKLNIEEKKIYEKLVSKPVVLEGGKTVRSTPRGKLQDQQRLRNEQIQKAHREYLERINRARNNMARQGAQGPSLNTRQGGGTQNQRQNTINPNPRGPVMNQRG